MPNDSKTYILNDLPSEKDALDFTPYVDTLVDVCKSASTPLTIGIFGTWGSGKTSLMRMVQKRLPRSFKVSWFNAWKYEKEKTIWRVLLLQVLTTIQKSIRNNKDKQDLQDLKTSLYQSIDREKVGDVKIEWGNLGKGVTEGALQVGLAFLPGGTVINDLLKEFRNTDKSESALQKIISSVHRESAKIHIDQIEFLEDFYDRFAKLIDTYMVKKKSRLIVFVDDLDRCLPEKAIEVLEAIKLFVDVPGCIFVLGLDQEVIARGVEIKYKEFNKSNDGQINNLIDGTRYLEKIVQLPFQIPPIDPSGMEQFIRSLSTEWPDEECPKVFDVGLGDNPRQVKRTVNVFLMLWKLADIRNLHRIVKPIRLAKVVAIQAVHPDLYNLLLKEEPRYLGKLEEYYRSESTQERKMEKGEAIEEKAAAHVEPPPALVPFLSQRGIAAVRRILMLHRSEMQDANFAGMPPDELKLYFTLTRRAEAPQVASFGTPIVFSEPQMVRIPAGKFLMGSTKEQAAQAIKDGLHKQNAEWEQPQHTVELSEYSIGKYPITNREYQAFVRDAKYKPPYGWDGDQFPAEKSSHPVVNVSWNDANAYCKWLSEETGKQYRLPTEAEWEKAARGEDGHVYPWGNEFDPKRANTSETKINDTSDVGKFSPQGDSPYGCADMVGNVWEWCNDWFDENEYENRADKSVRYPPGPQKGNTRVTRGGAFHDNSEHVRCANRLRNFPDYFYDIIGFRVASSPVIYISE